GTIRRAPAVEYSEEDWSAVLEVNLSSVFRLSQLAGKHMIESERGGKIVNIASLLSFQGGITVPAYAASKGGVAQLTKALANEWAKYHINVNAIAPGYMRTANTAALQADETRNRQILERIPAGRWGEPEDLAGAAVFLSSSASDYVNGHVLVVDGGWLGRGEQENSRWTRLLRQHRSHKLRPQPFAPESATIAGSFVRCCSSPPPSTTSIDKLSAFSNQPYKPPSVSTKSVTVGSSSLFKQPTPSACSAWAV